MSPTNKDLPRILESVKVFHGRVFDVTVDSVTTVDGVTTMDSVTFPGGLLTADLAAGIRRVKGVKKLGVRLGNWLTAEQGQALWQAPDPERLKGERAEPAGVRVHRDPWGHRHRGVR